MKNIFKKTLTSIWVFFVAIYTFLATIQKGGRYRINLKNVEGTIMASLCISIIIGLLIFIKCIKDKNK